MQSKTQWHSNLLKLSSNYKLPRTFSKFLKTFSSSSKPTNHLQIKSKQVKTSSSYDVGQIEHRKHNKHPPPRLGMHKVVPFGSCCSENSSSIPTNWFHGFLTFSVCHLKVPDHVESELLMAESKPLIVETIFFFACLNYILIFVRPPWPSSPAEKSVVRRTRCSRSVPCARASCPSRSSLERVRRHVARLGSGDGLWLYWKNQLHFT